MGGLEGGGAVWGVGKGLCWEFFVILAGLGVGEGIFWGSWVSNFGLKSWKFGTNFAVQDPIFRGFFGIVGGGWIWDVVQDLLGLFFFSLQKFLEYHLFWGHFPLL